MIRAGLTALAALIALDRGAIDAFARPALKFRFWSLVWQFWRTCTFPELRQITDGVAKRDLVGLLGPLEDSTSMLARQQINVPFGSPCGHCICLSSLQT